VRIRDAVWESLVAHARDEAPNECCGLLVGTSESIDDSVRTRNLEPSPTRFRIDPAEHIALNRRLRSTPHRVVGAYHSHPRSPASPSPSDNAEAFYPEFIYLIVSLAELDAPVIRGYRLVERNLHAVELVRVP
jgi:[CysO sulfur-carrier protein]-S-L-cysteine hydrolase